MFEIHRLLSSISALFGVWIAMSALTFDMAGGQFLNAIVVGAAIFLLAGYSAGRAGNPKAEEESVWVSGLAATLGLWVVLSPFVFAAASSVTWNAVVSGLVVVVFSGYRAYEVSQLTTATAGGETGS